MHPRISFRPVAMVIAAFAFVASAGTQAQGTFPTGPVRVVVPFPPGGSSDGLTRTIAEQLAKKWGQPVVVDNRPGGNSIPATDIVAKGPADGHTLGVVAGLSHAINPLIISKLPYDTLKDLTGVMMLTRTHMAVLAHPSFPANNFPELVALARKDPGKVAYAFATTGVFLGVELFNSMAGIRMGNVPYKGSGQALTDLLGGHVQLLVDAVSPASIEHVRTGKIKVIGTLGDTPSALMPNASLAVTVAPGFEFSGQLGMVARAGTPPALLRKIRDDIAAVMQQPEVAQKIRDMGQDTIASRPDQFDAFILGEMKRFAPIVRATGVKLD